MNAVALFLMLVAATGAQSNDEFPAVRDGNLSRISANSKLLDKPVEDAAFTLTVSRAYSDTVRQIQLSRDLIHQRRLRLAALDSSGELNTLFDRLTDKKITPKQLKETQSRIQEKAKTLGKEAQPALDEMNLLESQLIQLEEQITRKDSGLEFYRRKVRNQFYQDRSAKPPGSH